MTSRLGAYQSYRDLFLADRADGSDQLQTLERGKVIFWPRRMKGGSPWNLTFTPLPRRSQQGRILPISPSESEAPYVLDGKSVMWTLGKKLRRCVNLSANRFMVEWYCDPKFAPQVSKSPPAWQRARRYPSRHSHRSRLAGGAMAEVTAIILSRGDPARNYYGLDVQRDLFGA
jgi:hypothetical protein